MLSQSNHSTRRRRWPASLAALALAGAGTLGANAAQAEPLALGTFIGAIAKAYGTMNQGLNLLKRPSNPAAAAAVAIVAEIKKSEENILSQLQLQMFLQQQQGLISYRSKVQTVLDRFSDMSSMLTNNSQLPVIRTQTQLMSDEVLTFFDETVRTSPDIEASFQLAPAFNLLLVTHLGILRMAGEINANDTMPATFYGTQLRRGMRTDYRLIGGQEQACGALVYPPVRSAYFIGTRLDGSRGQLVQPHKAKTYKQSQLYRQKFSNVWYSVRSSSGFTYDCNPKTRRCVVPHGVGGTPGEQSCDNPSSANFKSILASCLSRADNLVSQKFNADPTVLGIRESMRGMMSLGLVTVGTPGGAFPSTNLAQGAYFDPSVVNQACGTHPLTGKPAGREYLIYP